MRTITQRFGIALALLGGLSLAACDDGGGDDAGPNPGTDAGPRTDAGPGTDGGGTDGGGPATICDEYCDVYTTNCTGTHSEYTNRADCVAYCMGAGWPDGMDNAMSGNSTNCRIYHAGVAAGDPDTHCPHAGPSGADTCGSVNFRTEASSMYTRVDRMGMPAVSTALIGSARKNAYNDANPSDDAAGTFLTDLVDSNTALHAALDDDLTGMNLTPCSMTTLVGGLPECFGQEVAAGVTVASLVVPDTLTINPGAAAGFPNGRQLADPVIDVTLSVILLRLTSGTCGGSPCGPTTLVGVNPMANDVAFLTEFPYLAAPNTP
ncbi:MAG: DUF4331 family protein [Sandaracinaceae bacterium]